MILTLIVGIGASTAIFTVVNSVMLRRLPYRTANRIVAIQELNPKGDRIQSTAANFLDWRAPSRPSSNNLSLSGPETPT